MAGQGLAGPTGEDQMAAVVRVGVDRGERVPNGEDRKAVVQKGREVPMGLRLVPIQSGWSNTRWNLMPTRMASLVRRNY